VSQRKSDEIVSQGGGGGERLSSQGGKEGLSGRLLAWTGNSIICLHRSKSEHRRGRGNWCRRKDGCKCEQRRRNRVKGFAKRGGERGILGGEVADIGKKRGDDVRD